MSDRRRNRSRSPIRSRSRSRSPGRKGTTLPKVLLYTEPVDARQRSMLSHEGCLVYDHLYPFRKASQFILNAEHHRVQSRTVSSMENFSQALARFAQEYFQPSPYPYDHFLEWLQAQRQYRQPIVIIGMTDDTSIRLLRRRGAVVCRGSVDHVIREIRSCPHFDLGL
jgi:hypothetical protein